MTWVMRIRKVGITKQKGEQKMQILLITLRNFNKCIHVERKLKNKMYEQRKTIYLSP